MWNIELKPYKYLNEMVDLTESLRATVELWNTRVETTGQATVFEFE